MGWLDPGDIPAAGDSGIGEHGGGEGSGGVGPAGPAGPPGSGGGGVTPGLTGWVVPTTEVSTFSASHNDHGDEGADGTPAVGSPVGGILGRVGKVRYVYEQGAFYAVANTSGSVGAGLGRHTAKITGDGTIVSVVHAPTPSGVLGWTVDTAGRAYYSNSSGKFFRVDPDGTEHALGGAQQVKSANLLPIGMLVDAPTAGAAAESIYFGIGANPGDTASIFRAIVDEVGGPPDLESWYLYEATDDFGTPFPSNTPAGPFHFALNAGGSNQDQPEFLSVEADTVYAVTDGLYAIEVEVQVTLDAPGMVRVRATLPYSSAEQELDISNDGLVHFATLKFVRHLRAWGGSLGIDCIGRNNAETVNMTVASARLGAALLSATPDKIVRTETFTGQYVEQEDIGAAYLVDILREPDPVHVGPDSFNWWALTYDGNVWSLGNPNVDNTTVVATRVNTVARTAADGPALNAFTKVGQDFYITDSVHHRINKLAGDGTMTVFAGTGAAGHADGTRAAATFQSPQGIASFDLAEQGYLIVADPADFALRIIKLP